MKLILLRHGESSSNVDRSILLKDDFFDNMVDLTEKGKQQAREAGARAGAKIEWGENNYLYFSPYLRTKQTTKEFLKVFTPTLKEVVEHPLLIEQEFKDFVSQEEVEEKKQRRTIRGKFYYRYKNGESPLDVYGRVVNFLNEIKINHKEGDTIVVVAHEVVVRCIIHSLLKLSIDEHLELFIENCEINEVKRVDNRNWRLGYSESSAEVLKKIIKSE